jgi:hypothetical protein
MACTLRLSYQGEVCVYAVKALWSICLAERAYLGSH